MKPFGNLLLRVGQCLFVFILIFSCSYENADLVLTNAKIITLNEEKPQAEIVAIRGNRILHVGQNTSAERYIGEKTKVLDLKGQLVIPGLVESHAHFMGLGYSLLNLDLTRTRNYQDLIDSVAAAVARAVPGEWIVGRGWHQERWHPAPEENVEGYPVHGRLSAVSPDNPVYLSHASGHAVLVNAKALEYAGIDESTKDPDGGTILKYKNQAPAGILLESAADLVSTEMDAYADASVSSERQKKAFQMAVKTCLENGITTFHDAGSSFNTITFFRQMLDEGELKVRLWVMINEPNEQLDKNIDQYRWIGVGNHYLTVRAIKRFIDGALGAHGAWLMEPYTDMPASTGLLQTPLPELEQTAGIALKHGFQLCTHAIGDRGNKEILDIYQRAFENKGNNSGLRWRVEHAQHLRTEDIPRFSRLGVIASMQTNHCTSDGPWVEKRLGKERAETGAYVWQKLIQSGAVVANGTDAPVERIDPMANFYSAVTRKQADGQAFYPDQKLSRMQALRAYTMNGAYAAFEEDIKGSIETGKLADITVLSRDILSIPEDEIPGTQIVYTIIGGKIRFPFTEHHK